MTRPVEVVLHVGQHKTGSKALQVALSANRRFLVEHGVAYPLPWRVRWWGRPQERHHAALHRAVRAATTPAGRTRLHALVRSLVSGRAGRVVLSAEDLFDMGTAHEIAGDLGRIAAATHALAGAFAAVRARVRVIVYLRRADHAFAAHYAQFIKGTRDRHDDLAAFRAHAAPRLQTAAILSAWEGAFGPGAITVRAYERAALPGGIVPDFFTGVLGLPHPPRSSPLSAHPEARNATPSRDHVEYLRLLNRRAAAGARVWPRAVVLAAAAADPNPAASGVAAYLSGRERVDLLACTAAGDRWIAERYRGGEPLFREAPPAADGVPPPPLDLRRALDIDVAVRRALLRSPWAAARTFARQVAVGRLPRRIAFLIPCDPHPDDDAFAWRAFTAFVGDPGWWPRRVEEAEGGDVGGGVWWSVGPTAAPPRARSRGWLLLGAPPEAPGRVERVAARLDAIAGIVVPDERVSAAWRRALPALADRPARLVDPAP